MARVLLIGATSAIAREVARLCARRGDRFYLLGRDAERLSECAAELREIAHSEECVVGLESADFNDCESNAGRVRRALESLGGLDLALVAHGLLGDQRASELDYAEASSIRATNLDSVISFLIPIANVLEAQGHGRLAVVSSVAADRGRPRNYTYGAAKAGVNTYLEGLRSRLWNTGARVQILKLGPVDTPMTVDHARNALFSTPERIAPAILRAIDGGRFVSYLPWYWRPIMAVVRNLPESIFQRLGFLAGR